MLNYLTGPSQGWQDGDKAKELRLESLVVHRESHQALIKSGFAENSLGISVDQLKNMAAAFFDVALERSHGRRLVCRRKLGKMQRKVMIRCKNVIGTRSTKLRFPN
jgi:hypothetical protein